MVEWLLFKLVKSDLLHIFLSQSWNRLSCLHFPYCKYIEAFFMLLLTLDKILGIKYEMFLFFIVLFCDYYGRNTFTSQTAFDSFFSIRYIVHYVYRKTICKFANIFN